MFLKICKVEGCNDKNYCKGYCCRHYRQIKRHGEIKNVKKITLEESEIIVCDTYAEVFLYNKYNEKIGKTIIDIDDIDKVKGYIWRIMSGYVGTNINNKTLLLHRLITDCPTEKVVDHKNHDTLDNRKCNLRICTIQENTRNRKCKGYFKYNKDKYCVYIMVDGKKIEQLVDTEEEAIALRKQWEEEYFGDFSFK